MNIDYRFGYLESVRAGLSVIVYPVQYIVNLPVLAGQKMSESLASRSAMLAQNRELRAQMLVLESRSQRNAALEAENVRLRELLDSSVKMGERVLVAELLAVELELSSRQVVVNKGSRQGVFLGQPVVDSQGVMGQIVHVGPITSTAMLLTDVSHAVPVQVNRSGLRAMAVGTGSDDVLELLYVPNNADVREGDLLVTSGMGSRFPPGYPVGLIIDVNSHPSEPFARVRAKPSARVLRAREVLLVWPDVQLPAPVGKFSKTAW